MNIINGVFELLFLDSFKESPIILWKDQSSYLLYENQLRFVELLLTGNREVTLQLLKVLTSWCRTVAQLGLGAS